MKSAGYATGHFHAARFKKVHGYECGDRGGRGEQATITQDQ